MRSGALLWRRASGVVGYGHRVVGGRTVDRGIPHSHETAPVSPLFSSAQFLVCFCADQQDSSGYSLAKEGAKREPDRAKHKEMPAPSIRCSERTFYGRGRGGWFNNRLFFDQQHS